MLAIPAIKIFMAFVFGIIAGKQMPHKVHETTLACHVDKVNEDLILCDREVEG